MTKAVCSYLYVESKKAKLIQTVDWCLLGAKEYGKGRETGQRL